MSDNYLIGFDPANLAKRCSDVLVIGGGIAGLTAAIVAAKKLKVRVLAKSTVKQTSTWYAQGGIAAALAPDDSPDLHYKDTLEAGAGLCDPEAVKILVEEAAAAISMLTELGAGFDRQDGSLRLGREGGHTVSRVVHAGDATGSAIAAALHQAVRENPNILIDDVFVLDLLTQDGVCVGALAYEEGAGRPVVYLARAAVIAAGGMGQVYEVTTNPPVATGDGQAMAYRKGAVLADLEFVQFHPTALAVQANPRYLISEAVRGEGAYLVGVNGERFMVGRHPLAELAPRDIVSQAVFEVMRRQNVDHVYIDARHLPPEKLRVRFPAIWNHLKNQGLDMSKDLIPVAPAAHYLIGGIKTDLFGRTNILNLYASGEVASTGVHGANRLASNSLLEGLVFSRRIGNLLCETVEKGKKIDLKGDIGASSSPAGRSLDSVRLELRRLMSEHVGVVRTNEGLRMAADRLEQWGSLLDRQYDNPHDWETVNMITIAGLIIQAALARRQSVGVHLVAG